MILLGVIEGVTEFLPVSSTGHLLLFEHWFRGELYQPTDLFNTVIQSGAVLAALVVFAPRVRTLVQLRHTPASRDFTLKLLVAFGITVAGMLVAKSLGWQLPKTARPVALATLIGGVLFIVLEQWSKRSQRLSEISWTVAVACGLAQIVAGVFPGTSRSGATILVALALGMARPAATEFSFLLGIPTLLAAGGYEVLSAFRKLAIAGDENWGWVMLGTLVAGITAFVVVRWLLRFVQTHTFVLFGWYRVALGVLILLFGGSGEEK